jgi:hypothetical protein
MLLSTSMSCASPLPPVSGCTEQIINQLNEFIAKQLARKFEPAQALLDRVSPALSKVLEGNIASSIGTLKKLPGAMGFKEGGCGLEGAGGGGGLEGAHGGGGGQQGWCLCARVEYVCAQGGGDNLEGGCYKWMLSPINGTLPTR